MDIKPLTIALFAVCLCACGADMPTEPAVSDEAPRGEHNGRLLTDGDFTVELAIYETGVPPEFRAWAFSNGEPVPPGAVDLEVRLTRLGNVVDHIAFAPEGGFLRGDTVIYEPHSFVVDVEARHGGRSYVWSYDSFEGRTQIGPEMAAAFGLATETAGPAVLEETVSVYGSIIANADRVREVSARFDGAIESVSVALGERVDRGQALAAVESNESLQSYTIRAPIAGIVTERAANAGEQTRGRRLFTIVDTSSVWAELALFPSDRARVAVGDAVTVAPATGGAAASGTIALISPLAGPNQAVPARVVLGNDDGAWPLGTFVTAEITVGEIEVPLAVKRSALQSFRDFTVVYAQIGDEYEVRMLDLGREAGDWVEVLAGLDPGTRYVTENSYILKADVEKSGASHDH